MEITLTEARKELGRLVSRAHHTHEPVILTEYGRPVAALISAADLSRYQQLQDQADLALVAKVKAESQGVYTQAEFDTLVESWEREDR
ncbi:type II toxin-antitoxin system Phd/YefM family antitoxin [Streptomyces sp. 21So2-11]|uniref:type II toxin-antitoxin system Phd/YefM family antitoxin n=1 Tax=Streptomyces sp. 21So2-11 TaxID=3144408 RepID=UPI00321A75A3